MEVRKEFDETEKIKEMAENLRKFSVKSEGSFLLRKKRGNSVESSLVELDGPKSIVEIV